MLKIFFITFFLAELIIAFAIIIKIYQFDKVINSLNSVIMKNQYKIHDVLEDFRIFLQDCIKSLLEIKLILIKKRDEYMLNLMKTSLIYLSLFVLKGKYKKSVLAFQMAKEIYEGIAEA